MAAFTLPGSSIGSGALPFGFLRDGYTDPLEWEEARRRRDEESQQRRDQENVRSEIEAFQAFIRDLDAKIEACETELLAAEDAQNQEFNRVWRIQEYAKARRKRKFEKISEEAERQRMWAEDFAERLEVSILALASAS